MSVLKIKGQNGQWTDVLSIKGEKGDNGQDYVLTENDKQEIAQDVAEMVDIPVDDVQINGTSIVTNGVAEIPLMSATQIGVAKTRAAGGRGIFVYSGEIMTQKPDSTTIKSGIHQYQPIVPYNQHESVFYGLAKASGDTTQSQSSNAVGTYTDDAKASIQSMLGVPSEDEVVTDVQINGTSVVENGVAEIPIAEPNGFFGVVKLAGKGLYKDNSGILGLYKATIAQMKKGTDQYSPIVSANEHESTFYGLAKAAGADEKNSTLPVGQYTESAKSAISSMLNAPESVSGMTPTITAKAGVRYICGECTTLDITTPESGIVDITFTSGTTPTVLTVTPPTGMTMMWANGFDSTALKANTVYEINIMDGCKGVACSWT